MIEFGECYETACSEGSLEGLASVSNSSLYEDRPHALDLQWTLNCQREPDYKDCAQICYGFYCTTQMLECLRAGFKRSILLPKSLLPYIHMLFVTDPVNNAFYNIH